MISGLHTRSAPYLSARSLVGSSPALTIGANTSFPLKSTIFLLPKHQKKRQQFSEEEKD
jgi:hypothetical protein